MPRTTLTSPRFVSEAEFSRILQAVSMRSDAAIVLDDHATQLYRVDLTDGTISPVGRPGEGPGEYTGPMQLFPMSDSAFLLQDRIGPKLLQFAADGRAHGVVTLPGAESCATAARRYLFASRARDAAGRFYLLEDPARATANGIVVADSSAVVRWTSPCSRDTLAYLPNPYGRDAAVLPNGRVLRRLGTQQGPFEPSVQWQAATDGRVAIVTPDPFRVQYATGNGPRVIGPVIAVPRLAVSDGHKAEWRERAAAAAPTVTISRSTQRTRMTMQSADVNEPARWPTEMPPFLEGALAFDASGHLWIRRTVAAGAPAAYLVVDRLGRPTMIVTLPAKARVVGFGANAVLVARTNADDLEALEVYINPVSR